MLPGLQCTRSATGHEESIEGARYIGVSAVSRRIAFATNAGRLQPVPPQTAQMIPQGIALWEESHFTLAACAGSHSCSAISSSVPLKVFRQTGLSAIKPATC